MPKYILQELPEEMTDGKKIVFPKMQTYTLHDYETVIQHMRAKAIIEKNGFMTLYDYANVTHQSRSVASKDLRQIVADANSGITTRGSHSHKVWIANDNS